MILYCVAINNPEWDWAPVERRVWLFMPQRTLESTEGHMQDMIARGTAPVDKTGIACVLRSDRP